MRSVMAAVAVAVMTAALTVAVPVSAEAAAFTVNDSGDGADQTLGDNICKTAANTCTLRAAVQQANFLAGTDVITVPAMTIVLGSELPISSSMTIQGAGARNTILTATSGHRNLYVTSGSVAISDLAIQDITTNAPYGAGIHQTSGTLTLTRIRVTNIKATANTTVYGPVLVEGGTMTMVDSEVSRNISTGNSSTVYGGGVSAPQTATVRIVNSTIADNQALISPASNSYFALGGGIHAGANTTVELESSTVAGNSAISASNGRGGNIFSQGGGTGSFWVKDSIVAGGTDSIAEGGNCLPGGYLGSRVIDFAGRNLIDDTTCGGAAAERTIADAKLRALGNYGGPTDTRPPAGDSPALNAASACVSAADQRGAARPIAGACDLGSVELGADLGVSASLSNTAPSPGADVILTVVVSNAGPDTTTGTTATVAITGAEILSATPQTGSCSVVSGTAPCTLPELAGGASTTVLLVARASASGAASFQATVSAAQPDPNPGNNAASVTATVAAPGGTTTGGTTPAAPTACSNSLQGTGRADRITGTANGDAINGKAGNDRLKGLAGADCLAGAGGKDVLVPGPGTDKASGGPGADTIKARDGEVDTIRCGGARDVAVVDKADKVARDCEVVRKA